ncbi:adenylate/guanylate cyclase domain-containing protein [Brevibacillus sp. SYSU BS000544]|uniref:adenylate/guanylate cyclase domain-containing protein n=1 Tax=Brevibacillus sp. SYSU BS000544 TaxID=3416443 RepID=UPI003CE47D22
MNRYTEFLASYIPDFILKKLSDENWNRIEPVEENDSGAMLFVDISGFTSLCEQLTKKGPIGLEELSIILNKYFDKMISLITGHGGTVVKFAGDALLAVWKGNHPIEGPELFIKRAAKCALLLQEDLNNREIIPNLRLSLRMLIGAGDYKISYVGGVNDCWELILTGETIDQINAFGPYAQLGKVLLSPQAYQSIMNDCEIENPGEWSCGAIVLSVKGEWLPDMIAPVTIHPELEPALIPYIPPSILASVHAGQADWSAELRNVTVLFIQLPNFHKDASLAKMHQTIEKIQTILQIQEGTIHKISLDEKGIAVVAAMGLPSLTHEDDAIRAIKAGLEIHSNISGKGIVNSIGIATGLVFCGSIGNAIRREYTMIGDTVNLAARLMQAADGRILCDEQSFRLTSSQIHYQRNETLQLKGFSDPVPVYQPIRLTKTSQHYQHSLVGRDAEIQILHKKIKHLLNGTGGTVFLIGEAGMGKSHLAADFQRKAENEHIKILFGLGDSIEQLTPYFAWRHIFHTLFALESLPENPIVRREHVLQTIHDQLPSLEHLHPLLNVVLPFEFAENEWTDQMTGRARAENIQEFFIKLIQRLIGSDPTAIILDDGHWLDSASWALLAAISQQLPNLLLLISMRPDNPELPMDYHHLIDLPTTEKITLKELTGKETLELICKRLGVSSLPEVVSDLILTKAEGHPFFSEELAYALRDSGLIEIKDGVCHVSKNVEDFQRIHFPNSLQGIITSRIDRLPVSEQIVLKVASVIGRLFTYTTLNGILPMQAAAKELSEHLLTLNEVNLTLLESLEPELTYIFKHIITHEVSYNLMLHSQRRQLHQALAEWYERQFADLTSYYSTLAYHWSKAENTPKTVEYLEKSGLLALRTGSYQDAVSVFRQVVALTVEHKNFETKSVAKWHRLLGESYMGIGDMTNATTYLNQALSLYNRHTAQTPAEFKKHMIKQLLLQLKHRFFPAYFIGRFEKNKEELTEQARCYFRLSEIYFFINKPMDNLYNSLHGLNLAEDAGPSLELAQITGNMCVTAGIMTIHPLARSYKKQALQVAEKVQLPPAKAWASMDISLYHIGIGEWQDAYDYAVQAMEIYEKMGDRRYWEASSYLYVKVLAYHHADFAKSIGHSLAIYESGKRSGNAQAQSWGLLGQAEGMIYSGKIEEAILLLKEAEALIRINIGTTEEIRVYSQLAFCYLKTEELERAKEYAVKALQLIEQSAPTTYYSFDSYAAVVEVFLSLWEKGKLADEELKNNIQKSLDCLRAFAKIFTIAKPRLHYYLGQYHWLTGNQKQAQKEWNQSLKLAQKMEMPYEVEKVRKKASDH